MRKRINTYILTVLLLLAGTVLYAQTYGDYTLYSIKNSTKAYLIDMSGNIYHSWTFAANAPTGYQTYMLEGGTLVRTVARAGNYFQGGPICGEVQKVDWNGNVTWDFVYSTPDYCSHHDICPMPNGNVLLIAYEVRTAAEVSAAGCTQSILMWPDKIVEIQPVGTNGGTVVWEWHTWDHLCQDVDPLKNNYVTSVADHPELLNINYNPTKDWTHDNGIDYNDSLDQIAFSSHAMNEIYVIDHSTTTMEAAGHTGGNSGKGGDFLYRWGNPAVYQAPGTADFNVVHDAHWVPAGCPKAGYIAGFNNKGGPGNKSCVDLINPPYDGYNYQHTPGAAYDPPTYNWRAVYSGQPSQDEGCSQQLPNGNTLITITFSNYMYEIDSNLNVVWSKTVSGQITNAFRYTHCYVSPPPDPVITQAGTDLSSSVTSGNQWFQEGTLIPGATGQVLTPSENGSYQVQVTDTYGCVSSMSVPFEVTWTGTQTLSQDCELLLTPNPAADLVSITGESVKHPFTLIMTDSLGNRVLREENITKTDVSTFRNGIYFISVLPVTGGKAVTRKLIIIH
jgi:hypothetical protein